MKRIMLVFTVIFLFVLLPYASADRYVNAADCDSMDDFLKAIEMGTTITTDGFVYIVPYDYEMDNVEGYVLNIYPDIKGCVEHHIFMMISKEQASNIEAGDYVSVSGKMFSRGNTGTNYYFNTQIEGGYVEKKEKPSPTILDLNEERYDMVSRVKDHRIGDIAKGNGLKIVLTHEWTNSLSSDKKTTYYFVFEVGNLRVQFHTDSKDLFKGDIIDFEGTIYNYDVDSKTLLCRDPVYQLHDGQ